MSTFSSYSRFLSSYPSRYPMVFQGEMTEPSPSSTPDYPMVPMICDRWQRRGRDHSLWYSLGFPMVLCNGCGGVSPAIPPMRPCSFQQMPGSPFVFQGIETGSRFGHVPENPTDGAAKTEQIAATKRNRCPAQTRQMASARIRCHTPANRCPSEARSGAAQCNRHVDNGGLG